MPNLLLRSFQSFEQNSNINFFRRFLIQTQRPSHVLAPVPTIVSPGQLSKHQQPLCLYLLSGWQVAHNAHFPNDALTRGHKLLPHTHKLEVKHSYAWAHSHPHCCTHKYDKPNTCLHPHTIKHSYTLMQTRMQTHMPLTHSLSLSFPPAISLSLLLSLSLTHSLHPSFSLPSLCVSLPFTLWLSVYLSVCLSLSSLTRKQVKQNDESVF